MAGYGYSLLRPRRQARHRHPRAGIPEGIAHQRLHRILRHMTLFAEIPARGER